MISQHWWHYSRIFVNRGLASLTAWRHGSMGAAPTMSQPKHTSSRIRVPSTVSRPIFLRLRQQPGSSDRMYHIYSQTADRHREHPPLSTWDANWPAALSDSQSIVSSLAALAPAALPGDKVHSKGAVGLSSRIINSHGKQADKATSCYTPEIQITRRNEVNELLIQPFDPGPMYVVLRAVG